MKNKLTATCVKHIDAPVSAVWEALTTPDLIKRYFFGTDTVSDWKVGSSLTFSGVWEGKEYMDKGTILQSEPGKIFKYNYWSSFSGKEDKPENYADITYELSPEDGGTRLHITQEGVDSEEQRKHSEENWSTVMNNMKEMLENKS